MVSAVVLGIQNQPLTLWSWSATLISQVCPAGLEEPLLHPMMMSIKGLHSWIRTLQTKGDSPDARMGHWILSLSPSVHFFKPQSQLRCLSA